MSTIDAARLFAALASSERLAIVDALLERARGRAGSSISEIARATGMSRFSASRHLAILRGAGLVTAQRGREGFQHRIDFEGLAAIEDWAYARAMPEAT